MNEASRRTPARLVARGAVVPLALLATWIGLVDTGWLASPLFVPAHRILAAPFVDPQGREVWAALLASLRRLGTGLAIGGSLAVVVGTALGLVRPLRRAIAPSLDALRQIALFAWIPLLTSWFGNGETAKLVFISISAFFPIFLSTEQGVRTVPAGWREAAAVLHLQGWRRLRLLIWPAALPSILIGLEIGAITAWIGTVGAEYSIGSGVGIGAFLAASRDLFRMDLVLVGVATMALTGFGLTQLCQLARRLLAPWRTPS